MYIYKLLINHVFTHHFFLQKMGDEVIQDLSVTSVVLYTLGIWGGA